MSNKPVAKFQPNDKDKAAVGIEFSRTSSETSGQDTEYLKERLGRPLTLGLSQICLKKPRDPIEFLAHFLYKYRENELADAEREKDDEFQEVVLSDLHAEEVGTI